MVGEPTGGLRERLLTGDRDFGGSSALHRHRCAVGDHWE